MKTVADHELERQLLGALLEVPSWLSDVIAGGLQPADFDAPAHQMIFSGMLAIRNWTVLPEDEASVALKNALIEARAMDAATLQALADARAEALNSRQSLLPAVESLRELGRQRAEARRSAEEAARQRQLERLNEDAPNVGSFLADAVKLMLARADGDVRPVQTPWASINHALRGGLWPGLYVLTSTTGSGKSQWTMQTALAAARQGIPVLYIGLELGHEDLVARLLGLMIAEADPQTSVRWSDLLYGEKSEALCRAVAAHEAELAALPIRLEVAPPFGWRASMLAERVRVLRELYPAPSPLLVVLDYLQLVAPEKDSGRQDLRERIGAAAYAGRAVARIYGASVLAVSSVSRENAKKLVEGAGKEPPWTMVGLGKESGEIEYSADAVLTLGHGESFGDQTEVHLAIAKMRGGSPSWQQLYFNGGWFSERPTSAFVRARQTSARDDAGTNGRNRAPKGRGDSFGSFELPGDAR